MVYIRNFISIAGADFVAANTTILFSPTENEVCTEVEIIDDDVPNEQPEQFILDITVNPQTNVPVPPVPVTILDNDVAGQPPQILPHIL